MDEFEAQAPGAFANARCINCAFACATTASLSVRLPRPPVGRPRPARPSRPRALTVRRRQQIAENSINVHLPLELAWLTVHRPEAASRRPLRPASLLPFFVQITVYFRCF